jgi:putative ABC transport system permease protein
MMTLKIAARNVTRNARRSTMTILAVAIGAMALFLFAAFVSEIFVQVETQNVVRSGHIALFRTGYFKYGTGDPAAYGIADYEDVIRLLANDPVLSPLVNVVTPTVNLFGIAGNFDSEASKTFFGVGVIPTAYNRMNAWDEHGVRTAATPPEARLNENDEAHGFVGEGLGRILKLCALLQLTDCPTADMRRSTNTPTRNFKALQEPSASDPAGPHRGAPRLDLLAATSAGAPNVVNFYVDQAVQQGAKEIDDAAVVMNFHLAQQLLYGRGDKEATSIVVQLNHTKDIEVARARLEKLIRTHHYDLETRELKELAPFYKQVLGMFSAIFSFIAMVMTIIVLFTVGNTMSMSVMERTAEIGTLRAIGIRKQGITQEFVTEGLILGVIGASLGVALGFLVANLVNHAGLMWQPPSSASATPLLVRTHGLGVLTAAIWAVLTFMAVLASWIPARRGARMTIVTALGHV